MLTCSELTEAVEPSQVDPFHKIETDCDVFDARQICWQQIELAKLVESYIDGSMYED